MSTKPILPAGVQARPGGKYVVRWREQGKQRGRVFATLTEAKTFNLAVRADLADGRRVGGPAADGAAAGTLGAWWDDYAELRRSAGSRPWSDRTADSYRLTRSKLGALGLLPLAKVSTTDIARWQGQLRREGLADSTIRLHTSRCSSVLGAAVESGAIVRNPAAHRMVRTPAHIVRETNAVRPEDLPSDAQVVRFTRALPPRLTIVGLLLAELGLRSGELRGLKVADIGEDVVRIRRQLVRPKGAPGQPRANGGTEVVGDPKTGSTRDIPITPEQHARLLEHVVAHTDQAPGSWVVQSTTPGQHLDATAFRTEFGRAVRTAKLPADWHPHLLRHHAASTLLRLGLSPVEVARVMGHSVAVLLATYAKITSDGSDRVRAAMAARSAALGAARPGLHAV